MPDSFLNTGGADVAPQPLKMIQADGFVVVARSQRGVIPPYKISYAYEHCTTLGDAIDMFTEYENGEYHRMSPVGIFAARCGMPLGGAMDLGTIARMQKEVGR